jgi:hypothetical protein
MATTRVAVTCCATATAMRATNMHNRHMHTSLTFPTSENLDNIVHLPGILLMLNNILLVRRLR